MSPVTVRHIQETVAEHFEVPQSVMSLCRRINPQSTVHLPRHVAMFFSRRLTGKSYMCIARCFNRQDHTTVINAERKIAKLIAESAAFASEINTLKQAIGTVENSHGASFVSDSVGA